MCFATKHCAALLSRRTHLRLMLSPTNPSEGCFWLPSAGGMGGILLGLIGAEGGGACHSPPGVLPSAGVAAAQHIRLRASACLPVACGDVARSRAPVVSCRGRSPQRGVAVLQQGRGVAANLPGGLPVPDFRVDELVEVGRRIAVVREARDLGGAPRRDGDTGR